MHQRGFYNGTLKPLMDKAADGRETLLFLDASHFVMGCDYLGFIYGKARRFVKSFSGRMRYNVLGVVDFATKEVVTLTSPLRKAVKSSAKFQRSIQAKPSILCLTTQGTRSAKQSRILLWNCVLTWSAYPHTALTSI